MGLHCTIRPFKDTSDEEETFVVAPGLEGYQPVGLKNIGNTCFMNSILQCIMATPHLHEYFCQHFETEKHYRSTRLSSSFCKLLQNAREGGPVNNPKNLKSQLSSTVRQFRGRRQHDAQEFMRFLIDRMHDELNRIKRKPKYRELLCDQLPLEEQSQTWAEHTAEIDNSVMTDLFGGQLISLVTCLSCGHKSATFDNFMDLSIEIPGRSDGCIDLMDCLETFFSTERITNSSYKCSGCDERVDIEKAMSIYRLPKILIIHLKRFSHSARSRRRNKISSPVQFPLTTLHMQGFAPHSPHPSVINAEYRLYGISHHMGSLSGGHYTSDIRNVKTGQWFHCDDSSVRGFELPNIPSSSAYVLFYVMRGSTTSDTPGP